MIIKSYPKSCLALMYFPDSTPHVACNHLSSWIRRCKGLPEALDRCHQSRHSKYFSAQLCDLLCIISANRNFIARFVSMGTMGTMRTSRLSYLCSDIRMFA